jgi:hypothetical protein
VGFGPEGTMNKLVQALATLAVVGIVLLACAPPIFAA